MSIKAVLFDLDGTLLPMDQDEFVKAYLGLLGKRLAPKGYEFEKFMKVMWAGVGAMVQNDGSGTNEAAFWKVFTEAFGEASLEDKPFIDEFYHNEFNKVQAVCGFHKAAREIVELVREMGKMPVLATNPLFPHTATENRMRWAGLEPEECIMIGNDVDEDMVPTEKLGMKVFLLTNCLINKNGQDISSYPQGDFEALRNYLKEKNYNL